MNNVAIIGGRSFTDYNFMKAKVESWEEEHGSFKTVVSGAAIGADTLAVKYADEHSKQKLIYPANWSKYGRAAGPIRNKLICECSDVILAFPTTDSIGTYDTIRQAKAFDIPVYIFTK